jgi:hypothetical protein
MPVSIETDPELKRAIAVVPAGTRWAVFEAAAIAAVQASPQLSDWNWIIDDQGPMDDVDANGMSRIGETFRQASSDPQQRTYTVVVTEDPFFATWARVIDLNYGERRHFAAPTFEAAISLLSKLESRDPSRSRP